MTEPFIPQISMASTADDAIDLLVQVGWRAVGTGDWATALANPGDTHCARVVPFDPAYRIYADDVLAGPPNRWLPRIDQILPLRGSGYVVIMQRLWAADETAANHFCAALGVANTSGYAQPPLGKFDSVDDVDLAALRVRVQAMIALGAARYRLWGGSDIRAGNVMADALGRLKLVDPVFLAGLKIVQAIGDGDAAALVDFTRAQLEDFLTIAAFLRTNDNADTTGGLRAALDRLDLTQGRPGSPAKAEPM